MNILQIHYYILHESPSIANQMKKNMTPPLRSVFGYDFEWLFMNMMMKRCTDRKFRSISNRNR